MKRTCGSLRLSTSCASKIRVFGSMSGLFNMILFLLLMVGLASIIVSHLMSVLPSRATFSRSPPRPQAVQLFRGDIPQDSDSGSSIEINFKQIYNSWLGMYQVCSGISTASKWAHLMFSCTCPSGLHVGKLDNRPLRYTKHRDAVPASCDCRHFHLRMVPFCQL